MNFKMVSHEFSICAVRHGGSTNFAAYLRTYYIFSALNRCLFLCILYFVEPQSTQYTTLILVIYIQQPLLPGSVRTHLAQTIFHASWTVFHTFLGQWLAGWTEHWSIRRWPNAPVALAMAMDGQWRDILQ